MNTPNEFLSAALRYNTKGFSVIPVHPRSKAPIPTGWQRYSTTRSTKEEIERWWTDRPNANIGFALGPASGTDGRYLFVVDQDVLKDANHVPILNEDGSFKQKGDISGCPATLSQTTGSGGKQFFYWAPLGYVIGNSKPRPLIDVKGLKGQVLVPPSVHPNGNSYVWDMDELSRDTIAEFPQDALDALLGRKAPWAPSSQEVLGGVPIGLGLRHMGIAQVAGTYLRGARTPEAIALARSALYTWDKEMNKSPEPWHERKLELDKSFDGILALEMTKPKMFPPKQDSRGSRSVTVRFSDIQTEEIHWLWPERIALGKLTLFVGDPNVGKSLLTSDIAAIISKGRMWPVDNTESQIGDVILLSAEDGAADTVKPRLEAAGADCSRVHSLQGVHAVDGDGRPIQRMFSLKHDLAALENLLVSLPECKLVVIDPISAYLDDTDSHRNASIRGLLAPLAALAEKHKVAILAVDHLNKNSKEKNMLYRPGGSLAFVAAARAAYLVTRDKEDEKRRLVLPIKNNIAKENTGLAYTIVTAENNAPTIVWEPEPVSVTADEALGQMESSEQRSNTDWAIVVLETILAKGPLPATQIQKEAQQAGIVGKPLRRAREKLGIKPYKDRQTFSGPWWWALPGHEDAQDSEEATPAVEGILVDGGHLQDAIDGKPSEDFLDLGMDDVKDEDNIPV